MKTLFKWAFVLIAGTVLIQTCKNGWPTTETLPPGHGVLIANNYPGIDSNYVYLRAVEAPVNSEFEAMIQGSIKTDIMKPETAIRAYILRFKETALQEQIKYGIPASITLAQGILESGVGKSVLATKHNNHFGIKCFSRKCKSGHCVNLKDDSHKDFFKCYSTAWESYRDHSLFLQRDNYKQCHECKDYIQWAKCLKKKGYATNKKYDKKLIRLIDKYKLSDLDK